MNKGLLLLTAFIFTTASMQAAPGVSAKEASVLYTEYVDSYPALMELCESGRSVRIVLTNDIFMSRDLLVKGIDGNTREVIFDLNGHALSFSCMVNMKIGAKDGLTLDLTIIDNVGSGAVIFTDEPPNTVYYPGALSGPPGGIENYGTLIIDGATLTKHDEYRVTPSGIQWPKLPNQSAKMSYSFIPLIDNKSAESILVMNSGRVFLSVYHDSAISNNLGTVIINGGVVEVLGHHSAGINNGGTLILNGGTVLVQGQDSVGILNQFGREGITVVEESVSGVYGTVSRNILHEENCMVNGGTVVVEGERSIGIYYEGSMTMVIGDVSVEGVNAFGIMWSENKFVKQEYRPPTLIGGIISAEGQIFFAGNGMPAHYIDYRGEMVTVSDTVNVLRLGYSDVMLDSWYANAVYNLTSRSVFSGYPDGSFRPDESITRAECIALLARLTDVELTQYDSLDAIFTDVATSHWAGAAIAWGVGGGIVEGHGNGEFRPGDTVTREQFVTMLYRYALSSGYSAETEVGSLSMYADASEITDWALDAMRWAIGVGLMQGYPAGYIAPKEPFTRAEAAVILMRYQ